MDMEAATEAILVRETVTVTQIIPEQKQKGLTVLTMKLSTKTKKAAKIIAKSTKRPTITEKGIL